MLTRLDHGNAVLYGLPAVQLCRLQSVQNTAARLIFGLRRTDHVTDALSCRHWVRAPERIQFKLAVLKYRTLHGSGQPNLCTFTPVSGLPERRGLRTADSLQLVLMHSRLSTSGSRASPVHGRRPHLEQPTGQRHLIPSAQHLTCPPRNSLI